MRGGRQWRRRWSTSPGRYDQEPGLHAGCDRYWSSEDGLRWALKEHLISWNIYVAEGQDLAPAFDAGMRWWGQNPKPPLNNVMLVSGFVPADFLISIEAIAVVPQQE